MNVGAENKKDTVLLLKIKQVIGLLNEIDEIAKKEPVERQRIEWELSDLYHMYENLDFGTVAYINIGREIERLRKERREWKNVRIVLDTYRNNIQKIIGYENRKFLESVIMKTSKDLNQPYKNRIITQDRVKELLSKDQVEATKQKSRREQLEDLVNIGKTNTEIAKTMNISVPYVSVLKKKYDLSRKGRN